jgi:hypothetical protein
MDIDRLCPSADILTGQTPTHPDTSRRQARDIGLSQDVPHCLYPQFRA